MGARQLTPANGIQKLGQVNILPSEKERNQKHSLVYFLLLPSNKQGNDNCEAKTRIVSLLRKAVEKQLVADVPVGAFLSGGLDSSSVVNLQKNLIQI